MHPNFWLVQYIKENYEGSNSASDVLNDVRRCKAQCEHDFTKETATLNENIVPYGHDGFDRKWWLKVNDSKHAIY